MFYCIKYLLLFEIKKEGKKTQTTWWHTISINVFVCAYRTHFHSHNIHFLVDFLILHLVYTSITSASFVSNHRSTLLSWDDVDVCFSDKKKSMYTTYQINNSQVVVVSDRREAFLFYHMRYWWINQNSVGNVFILFPSMLPESDQILYQYVITYNNCFHFRRFNEMWSSESSILCFC